jgi:ribosomal protein S18 acetylase RimI-like enzyme
VPTPRVWRAELDEAETVAALLVEFRDWAGSTWPSDNAFLASVERLMEDPNTEYLLGAPHDDAPPGGVCQLRFRHSVWTASDDCWLEDLWVQEPARRSGLGRALVIAACEHARTRGCRRIELDVSEANAPALALYEAAGFRTGKLPEGRDLFLGRRLDENAR